MCDVGVRSVRRLLMLMASLVYRKEREGEGVSRKGQQSRFLRVYGAGSMDGTSYTHAAPINTRTAVRGFDAHGTRPCSNQLRTRIGVDPIHHCFKTHSEAIQQKYRLDTQYTYVRTYSTVPIYCRSVHGAGESNVFRERCNSRHLDSNLA